MKFFSYEDLGRNPQLKQQMNNWFVCKCRVEGGWMAFDSVQEYKVWKKQK